MTIHFSLHLYLTTGLIKLGYILLYSGRLETTSAVFHSFLLEHNSHVYDTYMINIIAFCVTPYYTKNEETHHPRKKRYCYVISCNTKSPRNCRKISCVFSLLSGTYLQNLFWFLAKPQTLQKIHIHDVSKYRLNLEMQKNM